MSDYVPLNRVMQFIDEIEDIVCPNCGERGYWHPDVQECLHCGRDLLREVGDSGE